MRLILLGRAEKGGQRGRGSALEQKCPASSGRAAPRRRGFFLAAAAGLSVFLSGCAGGPGETSAPALLEPVGAVRDTAVVTREDCYKLSIYSGQVVPGNQEAYFPQDGTVTEILVHVGDTVTKGQVLIRLDESGLKEQMRELEEEVSQKRQENSLMDTIAQKQEKQLELRLQELKEAEDSAGYEETSMELEALKLKNRQEKESRSLSLKESENALQETRNAYGNAEVTAPCDGVVQYVEESVKVGAAAKKDTLAAYISDDSQATVLCPELGSSDAQNAEKITATDGEKEYELTFLPYTTEETVSMALAGTKIMPRFSGKALPPCGTYLTISVVGVMRENAVVIPVNALYQDSSGSYVYCVRKDGTQERRDIETGLVSETTVEVTKGLEEGETVYVKS